MSGHSRRYVAGLFAAAAVAISAFGGLVLPQLRAQSVPDPLGGATDAAQRSSDSGSVHQIECEHRKLRRLRAQLAQQQV